MEQGHGGHVGDPIPPLRRHARDRRADSRGAALVEFLILVPVLILVCFGLIEYGFVFRDDLTITSAARAGARTATAAQKNSDADYRALLAVNSALGGLRSKVQKVVIYKSTTTNGAVPAACKTASQTNICNTYDLSDLNATVASNWSTNTGSATFAKQQWPPSSRCISFVTSTCVNGPEYLGVWIQTTHSYVTRVFGTSRSLSDSGVLRLEPDIRPGTASRATPQPITTTTGAPATTTSSTTTTTCAGCTTTVKPTTTTAKPTTTTAGPATTATTAKPTTTAAPPPTTSTTRAPTTTARPTTTRPQG